MFESDENDIVHMQRISRETVEFLREMKQNITTGKIERGVVEALRKSGIVTKVQEHDTLLNGLFRRLTQMSGLFDHADEKIRNEKKKQV